MTKLKKWVLFALTLGMTATLAFACGKTGGDAGSSSSQQSSSVTSSEEGSSESVTDSSEDVADSSEDVTDSGDSSESVHTCVTEGEWMKNSTGHWLKCDCNKPVLYAKHSGGNPDCGEQAICDVCGSAYGAPKDHEYGDISDGEHGMAYYCTCGDYILNEELVDFIVPIESGKEPVVLQLSDTQTCNWGDLNKMCNDYVRETVKATKPDLIILTGDIVYGRFDPEGALLKDLIRCMEELQIPWAPVFGNHDNESLMGVDWQCQQLEAAEYCLFKQGNVTGNGNYTVGLEQDGKLLRVFYMMDSNGCGTPMCDSNGVQTIPPIGTNVVKTSAGFGSDQVTWFIDSAQYIRQIDESVKFSMAYHIQSSIFSSAFLKYEEYDGRVENSSSVLQNPLNLDTLEGADETDFGYLGRTMKGPWSNASLSIANLKSYGVDSIFVGHEHCNSVSIVYEGIRFQYGQKSSTYDRYNTVLADGTIFGGYIDDHPAGSKELIGGTVIPVSSVDGSIGKGYIYYCGDPFGTQGENGTTETPGNSGNSSNEEVETETVEVNGVSLTDPEAGVTLTAEAFDENVNAYKVTATKQGKVFIDPALVANKSTFTFTAYVAEVSDPWSWLIRLKPNESFTNLTQDGKHITYNANDSTPDNRKVVAGQWKTFTVDISAFGDQCTEFSFIIPAGGTVWFRDITIA